MFRTIAGLLASLCFGVLHAEAVLEPAKQIAEEVASGIHPGFESFIMQVDGQVVGRAVAPTLAKRPPDLRSATKSITALLIGIAIDQGAIPSVQTKVMDLLPARRRVFEQDARKAAMTLEDLLTMRSGLDCNDWDPKSPGHEDKMYRQRDWVAFWSEQRMRADPGKEFSYCTGNVVALGEILEAAVNLAPDAFALKYLFVPIEVQRAEWQYWDRKHGVDTGGHLRLPPDDLLKIGELILGRGAYQQKRIVSEAWIEAMTTERTSIPGMNQRYGYLWWLDHTKDPNLPQTKLWWAQGNGGSVLMIMPGVDAVMLTTGTRFNQPDMLEPMLWLRDRLLPALRVK
ncbi:serine hydrolase domain-containing protein [Steroidobacter sp.]|uniref:serine hydrolase domain-containing protein n=1 Tax=Steroidobacter sp. TaxID=1978227 RepID=UPI0025E54683|nr:serine hydrolase [Steroidobacter sp.]